jgi:quinol monooxygenase YgiN
MIVEYIRYRIPSDQASAFEQAYAQAAEPLSRSPHCLSYELTRCVDEPACYTLRIEWDSAEGHMRGFRSSPQFAPFFQAIKPYVKLIEEMRHYEPTTVVKNRG